MNYRRNFAGYESDDEFELDISEELYDEGEFELFDTEMYEMEAERGARVPPIKKPLPPMPRPPVPRPRRKPKFPLPSFRQTIVTPFVTDTATSSVGGGADDGDFKPIAVESPGGGRIKDKTDPKPADVETLTGVGGKTVELHRYAAAAWRALVKAARADGIAEPLLLIVSGYRSSARQKELWEAALKKYGSKEEARKWVAPPGSSAHQSGRAIDFHLGGKNSSANVANLRTLPAYKWLAANAERYGFYPYTAEPWHWEYNPPADSQREVWNWREDQLAEILPGLGDEFESLDFEEEYESVPLTAADSTLVKAIVPADACKVARDKKGQLLARPANQITHVVIHSIIGNYTNSIQSWKRGATKATDRPCYKPHYAISKQGEITQIVNEKYITEHGNGANNYSIGIEHDGCTNDPSHFTEDMYKASAALTRDICQRYSIPMDRTHIIGHDEAPGTDHGDPGAFWDWDYYIALVNWDGTPSKAPVRIIIDTSSSGFFATSKEWKEMKRADWPAPCPPARKNPFPKHSYGTKYYRAKGTTQPVTDPAVFGMIVTEAGSYEVSIWWPMLSDNNPDVRIEVYVGNLSAPVLTRQVDQSKWAVKSRKTLALPYTATWFSLGTFSVSAGAAVAVKIPRISKSPKWVIADTVKLLRR